MGVGLFCALCRVFCVYVFGGVYDDDTLSP